MVLFEFERAQIDSTLRKDEQTNEILQQTDPELLAFLKQSGLLRQLRDYSVGYKLKLKSLRLRFPRYIEKLLCMLLSY